ncbi:hypothetical protein LCGC14_0863690 [marine sediment metagenome]|uniref:Uncharacterized protein n=1 Tax=marine sediment metagenome TaxID=412755 RepID=A0A0F9SDR6_9ZZZZ
MTELQIINMALVEAGESPITAIAELSKKHIQNIYDQTRDELLSSYPWPFALKRVRLTAAGILDCSTITITFADADPDTIADSGTAFVTSGFEADDLAGVVGSENNNKNYKINTAAAGTLTLETAEEVTAETLVNDTDLKLYAKPAYNWGYKYAIPSDSLRVYSVEENTNESSGNPTWDTEGDYMVTDAIDEYDQVRIAYIKQITDSTKFSTIFITVLTLKLATKLTDDKTLRDRLEVKSTDTLLDVFSINAGTGNPDTTRKDTSWQKR